MGEGGRKGIKGGKEGGSDKRGTKREGAEREGIQVWELGGPNQSKPLV